MEKILKETSTRSMRAMARRSSLTASDVCTIIEQSAKAGLAELSFDGLQISFVRTYEQRQIIHGKVGGLEPPSPEALAQMQQASLHPSPYNNLSDEHHIQRTKEQIEEDEIRLREDQLAQMLIEDPQKFEELLAQGELDAGIDVNDDGSDDGSPE